MTGAGTVGNRRSQEIDQIRQILGAKRIENQPAEKFLRRPEIQWEDVVARIPALAEFDSEVSQQSAWDIKYSGYVSRQQQQVERMQRLAEKRIPDSLDYESIGHLRTEARQKLAASVPSAWLRPVESVELRPPTSPC